MIAKHRIFVDSYLTCWRATEAARQAGYKFPNRQGWVLLRRPDIQDDIRARIEATAMTADEVLLRLAKQARGSLEPFIRISEDGFVHFDFSGDEAKANLDIIKKLKTKRTRRVEGRGNNAEEWEDEYVEVELYDAQAALALLGKDLGRFIERHDITLSEPIMIKVDR